MSRSLTVRDVPDEVVDELAARAARSGRSLQEYLRSRLTRLAETTEAEDWVARVRARKAATGGAGVSAETILRHRDEGRR